ncbi:MAG: UTP--glucose-1-phosphate uridylyltransferase [Planctomycetota bacterium]|nr:MAG: UTP--glucose-1-phosphate uridylyltransferase [Planctomycetota bacterium]
MNLRKAVITAAGRDQQAIPLQRLVDSDGVGRSALEIIIDEAVVAGVDEIAVVVRPGDEAVFRAAAGRRPSRLELIPQEEPAGYGAAVFCARGFVGDEPFLHFVGDHLYVSETASRCAVQLVETARREGCAVSAVQPTRESLLPSFGAVGGRRVAHTRSLYEIETVLEKPTPTQAEQELIVPGLRAGHYLCFFGMHVLTPAVFDLLATGGDQGKPLLSAALGRLARQERYLAFQVQGTRYDLGERYGTLKAQLALALAGDDRADVLSQLVELLARRPMDP